MMWRILIIMTLVLLSSLLPVSAFYRFGGGGRLFMVHILDHFHVWWFVHDHYDHPSGHSVRLQLGQSRMV